MTRSGPFDLSRWQWLAAVSTIVAGTIVLAERDLDAQSGAAPYAVLLPATALAFPNSTDSNSPAVWELGDGAWTLSLFNSFNGHPEVSRGASLPRLTRAERPAFAGAAPEGGYWFESVIRDADSWYAFYHQERPGVVCVESGKMWVRIGLARSGDRGATWTDLGPVLETPASTTRCDTRDIFFVGGVGDFSVMLDPDRQYAYLYYPQYVEADGLTGVSAARMAWADRDDPVGRVDVWADGAWIPPREVFDEGDPDEPDAPAAPIGWDHPLATPLLPSANRFDDARPGVELYWGPSLHWNTSIDSYVMLLNKAVNEAWDQGGVYVSFNTRLDRPDGWSAPTLLVRGGQWYPQVIGLDPTLGTDSLAGGVARFFMAGKSSHLVVFGRR
ncbi:MAG: hypothetical protein R2745_12450 [Vicinamibacterales bacterium]